MIYLMQNYVIQYIYYYNPLHFSSKLCAHHQAVKLY